MKYYRTLLNHVNLVFSVRLIYYFLKLNNTPINWFRFDRILIILQHRIVKAIEYGKFLEVRNIQRLLENSFLVNERERFIKTSDLLDCSYSCLWLINKQVLAILSKKKKSPEWILNVSINEYLSDLSFNKLSLNLFLEMKVGHFKKFATEKTISKRQIIFLNLKNYILSKLRYFLDNTFNNNTSMELTGYKNRNINTIFYSDGFLIVGFTQSQLELVRVYVEKFFKSLGFIRNSNKKSIFHINENFDFLGWTFKKYGDKPFCIISNKSIEQHRKEIKYLTKTIHRPDILVSQLNSRIIYWQKYHCLCKSISKVWKSMNHYLFSCLMKWGCKRHSNKTKDWIYLNYWKIKDSNKTFVVYYKNREISLIKYNFKKKSVVRRSKYTSDETLIQEKLILMKQISSNTKVFFWRNQKGICLYCKQCMDVNSLRFLHLHYRVVNQKNRFYKVFNFTLLHEYCHYMLHAKFT